MWPAGDLVAVEVVDASSVVVVASEGYVYVSRDSGDSWMSSRASAEGGLRDVSMADREVGWIVGEGGIWRTDDGGTGWRPQSLPDPEDHTRLARVAAIDRDRAVVMGSGGMRAFTRDGGLSWEARRDAGLANARRSDRSSSVGLACRRDGSGLCWSAGDGMERTRDGGRSWSAAEVIDPIPIDPIEFDAGEVEVDASDADRISVAIDAAERGDDPDWHLEPHVSRREIERFGRRRDPDALFEVISARIDEARGLLENAGVDLDRVVVIAAPPWDYASYLDDDPHFLDRYWTGRMAATSRLSIRAVAARRLMAIDVDAEGHGLAVGVSGVLVRSLDGGDSWTQLDPPTPHDLYDVAISGERAVVIGAQGGLWISDDGGANWDEPPSGQDVRFFDALRALSFSPDWELGVVVGENGRILRGGDARGEWRPLRPGEF